jgi:uncharacterized membrane protein
LSYGAQINIYDINAGGQVLNNQILSTGSSFSLDKIQGGIITEQLGVGVLNSGVLGNIGGTRPTAMNDNGQVIGSFYASVSGNQSFFYNGVNGSEVILLNVPDDSYSNTIIIDGNAYATPTHTTANDINVKGQIAGEYYRGDSPTINHAFVLDGNTYITFDIPGATNTKAIKINASGQVIGNYTDSANVTHAFVATPVVNTPAPKPTKEKDCKNGGWKIFGFKNKDQCEKYVEKLKGKK